MKGAPTIHFDEFQSFERNLESESEYTSARRIHPEFGQWDEKSLALGHIRIYEHKADLVRPVNVYYSDERVGKSVHHCMSIGGELEATFGEYGLSTLLSARSYHNLFLPGKEYSLGLSGQFHNVHIEIDREYYVELLCDSESWSSGLKKVIGEDGVFYPGEFKLSQAMLQTIYGIFNSPLSGSLKKLLIEAKVQELIALQLHASLATEGEYRKPKLKDEDLFHQIRKYLEETFLSDHSIKAISKHFGINEFSLKKGFREYFGTTIFDYLLSCRMEWSQELLRSTGRSVVEISSEVGYKYPHHFSTAFKRHFGYSPTRWRKAE